ncbi:hypothetical protein GMRT_10302 [Giardia muris]|uniref:Uncharacterized protein n=1 Tax=Giardia muris TaxID=5742 RepID=A0A4Z1T9P1_GIAMU|nr:hypothetical protein GMRT_10302 [Giardia muris]|eukprot:TNJ29877.1 hypothetical protein GMRT_10302 [Giardia muris]
MLVSSRQDTASSVPTDESDSLSLRDGFRIRAVSTFDANQTRMDLATTGSGFDIVECLQSLGEGRVRRSPDEAVAATDVEDGAITIASPYPYMGGMVDGVRLPQPLENVWFFRFKSENKIRLSFDASNLQRRTCSFYYQGRCKPRRLDFGYYLAGSPDCDPVLLIQDFYQTPECMIPFFSALVADNKCCYCLQPEPLVKHLLPHELIICYLEFLLNICVNFKAAGRRRSSHVSSKYQETSRRISIVGQGTGANTALKLALVVTLLSEGIEALYDYDGARVASTRLIRDGFSNINFTTLLSLRSIILCNPLMPSYPTILHTRNPPLARFLRPGIPGGSVARARAILQEGLGFNTGADSNGIPTLSSPLPEVSTVAPPASYLPNYLSFCPQSLVTHYGSCIRRYNKSTFAMMTGLLNMCFSSQLDDIPGVPEPHVFDLYSCLGPYHRGSFPLYIFLGSDFNLLSGEDLQRLHKLSDENSTVVFRRIPGCGADALNTCGSVLTKML